LAWVFLGLGFIDNDFGLRFDPDARAAGEGFVGGVDDAGGSLDFDGMGIGITFMCFDGEDGVIFFVFEVTADDVLIDVDDGFHGCPKYGNTGIKYGNSGI
jgi:hypothetical protein